MSFSDKYLSFSELNLPHLNDDELKKKIKEIEINNIEYSIFYNIEQKYNVFVDIFNWAINGNNFGIINNDVVHDLFDSKKIDEIFILRDGIKELIISNLIKKFDINLDEFQKSKIYELYNQFCEDIKEYANTLVIFYVPKSIVDQHIDTKDGNVKIYFDPTNSFLWETRIILKKNHSVPWLMQICYTQKIVKLLFECDWSEYNPLVYNKTLKKSDTPESFLDQWKIMSNLMKNKMNYYLNTDQIDLSMKEIFDDKNKYSNDYCILYHSAAKYILFSDMIAKIIDDEYHFYRCDDSVKHLTPNQIFEKYGSEMDTSCGYRCQLYDHAPKFAGIAKSCNYDLFDELNSLGETALCFLVMRNNMVATKSIIFDSIIKKYNFNDIFNKELKKIYDTFCEEIDKYGNTLTIYYIPKSIANNHIYRSKHIGIYDENGKQARIVNLDHSKKFIEDNNIVIKKYYSVPEEIRQKYFEQINTAIKN